MEIIIKIVKGFIIGLAGMTAGAGTFAILFGIYDKCMEILANPFKKFKENLMYIWPIALGVVISIILFGKSIIYLLENHEAYVKFAFLGLILGGIPTLIKQANKQGKNKKHLIPFIISFAFTLTLTIVLNRINVDGASDTNLINPVLLVFYGAIYALGAVMPGMSTVQILIALGVLQPILDGLMRFDLNILIPFGAGYIALVIFTAKFITYMFKKFYGYTYYAIIGFALTSTLMIVPKLTNIYEYIFCPLIAVISATLIYRISKLEEKYKEKGILKS